MKVPRFGSPTTIGNAFEWRSQKYLKDSLGINLRKKGGKGDAGVDLVGYMWLPPSKAAATPSPECIRILAQCKGHRRMKTSPNWFRELEGSMVRGQIDNQYPAVGIMLSVAGFTDEAIAMASSSPYPFLLMHLPSLSSPSPTVLSTQQTSQPSNGPQTIQQEVSAPKFAPSKMVEEISELVKKDLEEAKMLAYLEHHDPQLRELWTSVVKSLGTAIATAGKDQQLPKFSYPSYTAFISSFTLQSIIKHAGLDQYHREASPIDLHSPTASPTLRPYVFSNLALKNLLPSLEIRTFVSQDGREEVRLFWDGEDQLLLDHTPKEFLDVL